MTKMYLYVLVQKCTHWKGAKVVPNDVQLERVAILHLYETKTFTIMYLNVFKKLTISTYFNKIHLVPFKMNSLQ